MRTRNELSGRRGAFSFSPAHGRFRGVVGLAAVALVLAACNPFKDDEAPPLPGTRVQILSPDQSVKADPALATVRVALPRPATNAAWPQAGGFQNHAMHHLALGARPTRAWAADIGAGTSSSQRILAQPIVANGRIFAMDADAYVTAFDASSGSRLWRVLALPKDERDGDLGGGIAATGSRIFVATGSAELLAMDAASGKIIWRKSTVSPVRSSPAVYDGRVYVLTVENEMIVFSAADGARIWNYVGVAESSTLLGAASPAIDSGIVIAPLTSGEVVALRADNGRPLWSERLAAARRSNPITNLADIKAHPVIDRGTVYAISNAGRLAAIDLRTGQRKWDVDIGGTQTPWVAGDYVYVLARGGILVAVVRETGKVRWVSPLGAVLDEKQRQRGVIWTGPVLAGDRLIVVGSHGEAVSVSPYTGRPLGKLTLNNGVLIQPVVANNTIYFLDDGGNLVAMR